MRRKRGPTTLHPPSVHPPILRRVASTSDPPGSGKSLTPSFTGGAGTPDQAVSIQGHPSQHCLSKTPGYRR